jgi:ABC-2 type transport system ATP-binding protein
MALGPLSRTSQIAQTCRTAIGCLRAATRQMLPSLHVEGRRFRNREKARTEVTPTLTVNTVGTPVAIATDDPEEGRTTLLRAVEISKRLGRRKVLNRVSLSVGPGEVVALVGENGAGKSTLLKISAGLMAPDSGHVSRSDTLGYCPQAPGVLDLLTVDEHFKLFGAGLGLGPAQAVMAGRDILGELSLRDCRTKLARELSGGARQKLNLALALLGDPEILLLDEPYQGFDEGAYLSFWNQIDGWRDRGRAIVIVTHLLMESERIDKVVELHVTR